METVCGYTSKDDEKTDNKIVVYIDEELMDLIPSFLQGVAEHMQTIVMALAQDDFSTIAMLGHIMKGDGGSYGFYPITDIGDGLERAAKNRDYPNIKHLLHDLADYLARVEIVYETY